MPNTPRQKQLQDMILEEVYVNGPLSRIDIARHTGITPAVISRVTGCLIDSHRITDIGEEAAAGQVGRRKVMLQVAEGNQYFIGCDLAPEAFYFVIADQAGNVVAKDAYHFRMPFDPEKNTPETLIRKLQEFIEAHAEFPVLAIGMAVPGHYQADSERIASDHFYWMNFDLKPVNRAFSLPIYYENNVHAMAWAQRLLFKQRDDFIFMHVARGIFCSTIHDGKIYGRSNTLVGEVAHTVVNPEGELCDCGRHGCLRTFASEDWIVKKAQLLYRTASQTFLRQLAENEDRITFQTVLQAYELGDDAIITILNNAVKYLAAELSNLTLTVDARSIILHSPLFDQPALYERLQQFLAEDQFEYTSVTPRRLLVKPFSDYDGAIGGVGLAITHKLLGGK